MILSDLPSPAEASSKNDDPCKGFAQAGNRYPLFGIMLYCVATPAFEIVSFQRTTSLATCARNVSELIRLSLEISAPMDVSRPFTSGSLSASRSAADNLS